MKKSTQSGSNVKSPTRSNTPPASKYKYRDKPQHQSHVEFCPVSTIPRRGSCTTTTISVNNSVNDGKIQHHGKLQSTQSVDREKQRRLELVARVRDRREVMLKRVRKEKKFMLFSSLLAFLALFVWHVAVFTDYWFTVTQTEENIATAFNSSSLQIGSKIEEIFLFSNTGLWKTCSYFQNRKSLAKRVECSYFSVFLTRNEEVTLASQTSPNTFNEHVIEYTRAQICFASISVILMIMTIVAAFYTFKNSRYVYKRLAACLYFMTTISILVVLEVLVTSVYYADGHKLYPEGAIVKYGFSFYMGWSVFLVYLVNGCIFLILSRKRKYDQDDDADGGFITGR